MLIVYFRDQCELSIKLIECVAEHNVVIEAHDVTEISKIDILFYHNIL